MAQLARWWSFEENRVTCGLCPSVCSLLDGAVGSCGARYAKDGQLWTKAWGLGTPPMADPVEKKPLNHFLPGSKTLSFGLPGCNLTCAFCQNWRLSASRDYGACQSISAERCVQMAVEQGCSSIAFTYNEPIISSEFCIEVSDIAHSVGIKTIAVSNGYILADARRDLFDVIDAANIDLKGIDPDFYTRHCGAELAPVLETLAYIARSGKTWLEITNLLIPGLNDSDTDIDGLVDWICRNIGQDIPLHFSAYHPSYRMQAPPRTPFDTLCRAKERALAKGIRYVYLGNTSQPQNTACPVCQREAIQRLNYLVAKCELSDGKCIGCGARIAGVFN